MQYTITENNNKIHFEITSLTSEDISKMPYTSEDGFCHFEWGVGTPFGSLGYGELRCYFNSMNTISLISPEYQIEQDKIDLKERLQNAVETFLNIIKE